MQVASSVHAEPDSSIDKLPRAFGAYTLFDLIGKGGMARIYLARAETELGATRLCAVKEILPEFAGDARFSEMLIHEAKLAARLNHRRIVQVTDLGRADDHLFIAMEYVEGVDLNGLLRRCTERKIGLPAVHALGIVVDVLEGLDYAHRRTDDESAPLAIVHRDVSPSNILISFEGEVKLCDFGIAHANDLLDVAGSDAVKGKAGYMSPEQAAGDAVDARSDVFAAGIVLWELLAGHRLYRSRSELPLLEQARRAEIPALPDKGLPNFESLRAIVMRALAKNPDDRYASAVEFSAALEEYLATSGMLASRLKMGEWMATTFGTDIIDKRRASERRIPRSPSSRPKDRAKPESAPPPLPDSPPSPQVATPSESPSPMYAASAVYLRGAIEVPVSAGAMRAFRKELADAQEERARVTFEPESLAGSAMDVAASSSATAVDPNATDGRSPVPAHVASRRNRYIVLAAALVFGIGVAIFVRFFLR